MILNIYDVLENLQYNEHASNKNAKNYCEIKPTTKEQWKDLRLSAMIKVLI